MAALILSPTNYKIHTVNRFPHTQKKSPAEIQPPIVSCVWTRHYEQQYNQMMVWAFHWRLNQSGCSGQPSLVIPELIESVRQAVLQNWCFIVSKHWSITPVFMALDQRFSNYDPRTTCSPRDPPLWSLKKYRRKSKIQMNAYHTIAENLCLKMTHGNRNSLSFPITVILWNLLPYPSTNFPLYSQEQKWDLKHCEHGAFPAHLGLRL